MNHIHRAWYRWIDRSLVSGVDLSCREEMDRGEWAAYVGKLGENLAAKHLRWSGRKVLYRNFRAKGGGEVDIVYRDTDVLVFCEVKSRTSDRFNRPGSAVNRSKQGLIIRGANAWIRELNKPEVIFRFDVAEVILRHGEPPDIRLVEGAFVSPKKGLGM